MPRDIHEATYLRPKTLQRLKPLTLVARDIVEGVRIGMHKSPLRGFSTEFAQHRQYTQGDELRHVDWRVYARTGRYYVKLFEAETNFKANLLLDASSSMQFAGGGLEGMSKLEYAKYLAAALAYLIVEQRDSAGLAVFDSELRTYLEPKSSMTIVNDINDTLEQVRDEPRTNVAALLDEFARRMTMRGFVIVMSDLFDHVEDFLRGIEHLRFRGHNVIVMHTLDPHELEFPFGGTVKFEGLELEDEIVTTPARVRAAYLKELDAFLKQVRLGCERIGVDYVLVDTSKPVHSVLTAFLVHRANLNRNR